MSQKSSQRVQTCSYLTNIELTSERVAVHAHSFDYLRLRRGAISFALVNVFLQFVPDLVGRLLLSRFSHRKPPILFPGFQLRIFVRQSRTRGSRARRWCSLLRRHVVEGVAALQIILLLCLLQQRLEVFAVINCERVQVFAHIVIGVGVEYPLPCKGDDTGQDPRDRGGHGAGGWPWRLSAPEGSRT